MYSSYEAYAVNCGKLWAELQGRWRSILDLAAGECCELVGGWCRPETRGKEHAEKRERLCRVASSVHGPALLQQT